MLKKNPPLERVKLDFNSCNRKFSLAASLSPHIIQSHINQFNERKSTGLRPVLLLNKRLKLCAYSNPKSKAISLID